MQHFTAYQLAHLVTLILADHPQLTPEEAARKAVRLRRELNRMNVSWQRCERRYRKMTIVGLDPEDLNWNF